MLNKAHTSARVDSGLQSGSAGLDGEGSGVDSGFPFKSERALTSPMESKPSSWLSSSSMVRWISRSPPLCASYRFVPIASISSAAGCTQHVSASAVSSHVAVTAYCDILEP